MFLSFPSSVLAALISEESYERKEKEKHTRFMEMGIEKNEFPRRESNPDRQGESLLS